MHKKNIFQWILVIGFLGIMAFVLINKQSSREESIPKEINGIVSKQVRLRGQILNVELAITLEQQNLGLSGRTELKENEAMLFVFDYPGKYSFWMKDMNFPIDMIWIGEDNRVVYIKKDARPDSYPESFTPKKDAQYVLETISGFSEKNNLKEGDPVEFNF